MIGEDISFANLKAILTEFVKKVFGDTEVRFRPHFFPFTEPSQKWTYSAFYARGKAVGYVRTAAGWK